MSLEVFELQNEVALITGGGSGLGLGIAECFVAAGARVVIAGRREPVLKEACDGLGERASYEVCDVTDFDAADGLVERVCDGVGPLTILVNNAGNHLKKPAAETSVAEFDKVLQTHVVGAHSLTRAALAGMVERRRGSILFTASMTSFLGVPLVIAYAAAKSAYLGMVRSLAAEVSRYGVRANAIAPGWIESPLLRQALRGDRERADKILGRTPMARFGEARDIGWAAVYLCSPAAKFVTGTVLAVDGGASIGF